MSFEAVARKIVKERYPEASCAFLAGSFVRGENSRFSDLDLVILYPSLPSGYRESFIFESYPVEAFIHDPETLRYFFEEFDRKSGRPALVQMVREGIEIPAPNAETAAWKKRAEEIIAAGPPPYSEEDLLNHRYRITDQIDDLRDPLSDFEALLTVANLSEKVGEFYLRANGRWGAMGKTLSRAILRADPAVHAEWKAAFKGAFERRDWAGVIAFTEKVLKPFGGFFFDGDLRKAPPEFRLKKD